MVGCYLEHGRMLKLNMYDVATLFSGLEYARK